MSSQSPVREEPPKRGRFRHPRWRHTYMFIGIPLVIVLYVLIDPRTHIIQDLPFGANTVVLISELLKAMWYVGFMHMSMFALFDYLDIMAVIEKAAEEPRGAGMVFIGMSLYAISIAVLVTAAVLSN